MGFVFCAVGSAEAFSLFAKLLQLCTDSAVLWAVARQAPLSVGFSRQEYWSGLPFPLPGDLPDPGIKPASLKSPALAGVFFTTSATWEAQDRPIVNINFILIL